MAFFITCPFNYAQYIFIELRLDQSMRCCCHRRALHVIPCRVHYKKKVTNKQKHYSHSMKNNGEYYKVSILFKLLKRNEC